MMYKHRAREREREKVIEAAANVTHGRWQQVRNLKSRWKVSTCFKLVIYQM